MPHVPVFRLPMKWFLPEKTEQYQGGEFVVIALSIRYFRAGSPCGRANLSSAEGKGRLLDSEEQGGCPLGFHMQNLQATETSSR